PGRRGRARDPRPHGRAPAHRRPACPRSPRAGAGGGGLAPRAVARLRRGGGVGDGADGAAGRVLLLGGGCGGGGGRQRDVFAGRESRVRLQVPGGAMSAMAPRLTPDSPPPSAPVADARDVSRPVPFLRAAKAVFDLSLEGMVWSRRSLLMVALLFGPALLAVAVRIALSRLPPRVGAFDL